MKVEDNLSSNGVQHSDNMWVSMVVAETVVEMFLSYVVEV